MSFSLFEIWFFFSFLTAEFWEFIICSRHNSFGRHEVCKYFISFHKLPFVDGFHSCAEDFYFDVIQLDFCLCYLCFWCLIQNIFAKANVKVLEACVLYRSFTVQELNFLIHFEWVFVPGVGKGFIFILLHVAVHFS